MIIDKIENAHLYYGLGPRFAEGLKAIAALDRTEACGLKERVHLDGKNLHYSVSPVVCKAPDDNDYEAHVRYADIQYVLDGEEYMGWANLRDLTEREPYVEDIAWYRGKGTMLRLTGGEFVIFFPEDAHMPCRTNGTDPCTSIKLVMKVKL